jgi:hypothetical protein
MDRKQAQWMANCFERFLQRLNQGQLHARFHQCFDPATPHIAFNVSEKLSLGERITDGSGNLSNHRIHQGPTHQMCEVIAMTSSTDEEVIERFRKWTFEKIDTTRSQLQGASAQDIDQIIATRVSAILQEQLAKLLDGTLSIRAAAAMPLEQTVTRPPIATEPKPQVDKMAERQAAQAKTLEQNEMWHERARLMGMDPPQKAATGNGIARKWLKEAEKRWTAYLKSRSPVDAPVATAPAPAG